jgi:hypothetical protein
VPEYHHRARNIPANLRDTEFLPSSNSVSVPEGDADKLHAEGGLDHPLRYLLKKSRVRCQASLAAVSS